MADHRFPFQPLAELVAARMDGVFCAVKGCPECSVNGSSHVTAGKVARYLGFHESAPERWIPKGLTDSAAERACLELGICPEEVPGWDWYGSAELDDEWLTAWDEGRVGPDGEIRPYGPFLSEVADQVPAGECVQGTLFELAE